MAILDQQTVLWDNVALTTGTVVSTNTIDCGTPGATPVSANRDVRDIGVGEPLAMVVFVTVVALIAGTETYEFDIIQSAAAALTTPTILAKAVFATAGAPALAASRLTAGSVVVVPLPGGVQTARYLGGQYIGANSAGISITAAILPLRDVTQQKYYATAIVIQ